MVTKMLKLVAFVLVMSLAASSAQAQYNWDGGGADDLWDTAANWQDDTMPPETGTGVQIVIDDPCVGQPVFEVGMDYTYHGLRVSQTSTGLSTLTMTGGTFSTGVAPVFVGFGVSEDVSTPDTEGIMYFSGGIMNANNGFVLALYEHGTLNISGTAVLNVSPMGNPGDDDYRDNLTVACKGNGVLNMDGGTINSVNDLRITQRSEGHGIVNMTAGTMNLEGDVNMGMGGAYGNYDHTGEMYLNGGTVNADGLVISPNASLDIAGGTMILEGDDTVAIQAYIDDGLITGYGGNVGAVVMDYDETNAGKTTLTGDSNFNSPPQVEAGAYQSILSSETAQLAATVTDDGNPTDPGRVALTWSKLSGPSGGDVTFDPCNSVEDPCVTFTVAGFYELQLSATDSDKDACDVVTIYVRADDNPIAHWAFDTGTGTAVNDDSANNNVGIFAGGSSEPNWVDGWVNDALYAIEFYGVGATDVASYVDITTDTTSDPNIDGLQYEVTLAAWFKIGDLANAFHPAIVANGHQGWRLYVETDSGDLYGKVTFTPGDGLSGSRAYSTMSVDDGYWHHVVGVYDRASLKAYLYVDGQLDAVVDKDGLLDTTDGVPVIVGARQRTDTQVIERSWNGMLDDVRVYSYSLSADQVADLAGMGARITIVDAGENQTFSIQDGSLQLDATVIDDGKPVAATLTWSKTSGPGDVDFTNTAIEDPCAEFTVAGTYVLRLTADDTLALPPIFDEVTITVEDPTCDDIIADGLLIVGDISGPDDTPDCYVNLYDFAAFAGNWLRCNNPQDLECEFLY